MDLALSEFDLTYESAKAIKGQVMADSVAQHCRPELDIVDLVAWTLFFEGSSCDDRSGFGIVLVSLRGQGSNSLSRLKLRLQTIKQNTKLF